MNLRDLFAKFSWYPSELVIRDEESDTTTKVKNYIEQDTVVRINGDREVSDFLVSYEPSRLWVCLNKILSTEGEHDKS